MPIWHGCMLAGRREERAAKAGSNLVHRALLLLLQIREVKTIFVSWRNVELYHYHLADFTWDVRGLVLFRDHGLL
jgi:hypothetical protein